MCTRSYSVCERVCVSGVGGGGLEGNSCHGKNSSCACPNDQKDKVTEAMYSINSHIHIILYICCVLW